MNEWAVAEFVSRVAERVSTAGEDLAGQLIDRRPTEFDVASFASLAGAFPYVDPPADFIELLRQNLLDAPRPVHDFPSRSLIGDRRMVYGMAAFGSIASAAVVAMFLFRFRAANRPAA